MLVFEFIPDVYKFREDAGTVDLSVSLAEGDLGEFSTVITAATDDNNINANATGKYIMMFMVHPYIICGKNQIWYERTYSVCLNSKSGWLLGITMAKAWTSPTQ